VPGGAAEAGIRAVVCDVDPGVRTMITVLVEERGGSVLAEADRSYDAIQLVDRFEANLVVIDMALSYGSGMDVVNYLRERALACQVVIFTAFASTVRFLEGPGIRVVEKPEFNELGRALDGAVGDLGVGATGERRRPARVVPAATLRSPSGLDDAAEFYRALAAAEPGDALLGIPTAGADVDALAGAVRHTIREQDRAIVRSGRLVVLLVSGGADGPRSVLRRLAAEHPGPASTAAVCLVADAPDPMSALQAVTPAGP
jgi:CheY-like chemotaxis protein